jgi:radical SAM enzyme (TIGR01210 family)
VVALVKNPFLSRVGAELRKKRPLVPSSLHFTTRVEQVPGGYMVSVWFRTQGCRHDRSGACTMCNYWASAPTTAHEQVDYVREALDSLTMTPYELLASPSGSMLDPWEVPIDARGGIYRLIRASQCQVYLFETCAETITLGAIRELRDAFDGSDIALGVEIGLESSDPWIAKYCVNKGTPLAEYERALAVLGEFAIRRYMNVSLGTVFLSPKEAIDDTVGTVRWAFDHGAYTCVVFPMHVKPFTTMHWLWEHGRYFPPSLWSLVEVLKILGPKLSGRTEISWHRSYDDDPDHVLISPYTCPSCYSSVVSLLDAYKASQDYQIVETLDAFDCHCHDSWRSTLSTSPAQQLELRVATEYELLGSQLLGGEWWMKNRAQTLAGLMPGSDESY